MAELATYMEIPLRRRDGLIRAYAIVDLQDYERFGRLRWCLTPKDEYVIGSERGTGRSLRLHREVMGVSDPEIDVDHIDGNHLNNRRSNLRIATAWLNGQNQLRLAKNNTSGYRGVAWDRIKEKWKAAAIIRGRHFFIGNFDDVHEAGRAASEFRAKHMPFSPDARGILPVHGSGSNG